MGGGFLYKQQGEKNVIVENTMCLFNFIYLTRESWEKLNKKAIRVKSTKQNKKNMNLIENIFTIISYCVVCFGSQGKQIRTFEGNVLNLIKW